MVKLAKQKMRLRRKRRIRSKIFGTKKVPRLCVTRSLNHMYVQLINDEEGKTVLSVWDKEIKKSKKSKNEDNLSGKIKLSFEVGKLIGKKAKDKKIKKVVFDRSGYKYHGRIKAVAEGARKEGLEF